MVHLWLAGKRVVDFILVLIELFCQLSRLRHYERILVKIVVFERGCGFVQSWLPDLILIPTHGLASNPKRRFDRFSRLCTAHPCAQHKHRHKDHATCNSVATGRIACYVQAMWPKTCSMLTCLKKHGVALTGRNTTGPPHAAPWWVTLHMRRVTNDDDRRQTQTDRHQRPLVVWPPTLCVGGPVIK